MHTIHQIATSTFKRLARELDTKFEDATLKEEIPWEEIIAPHVRNRGTERHDTDLYIWSWKKGFIEIFASEAKINFKADFDLYRLRYLLSEELKTNSRISHIGIHQTITPLEGDKKKQKVLFKMYQINKPEL